jgi:hypothetical protein
MLFLLFYYIVVSALCTTTGLVFYALTSRDDIKKPFIFFPVTGLILITLFSQIAALVFPVNEYCFFIFTALFLILAFAYRKRIYKACGIVFQNPGIFSLTSWPLVFVCLAMILLFNAGPTIMDDTESYHIQMVKWIHEYGTVPGIANLHERFGFNSSWFSSISFFLPPGKLNFYTALNGLLSFWFSVYLINKFQSQSGKTISSASVGALLVFILSVLSWPMIRGNAGTANYDFITTVLVVVLFMESIRINTPGKASVFPVEWILWPVYLFTVRTINYPLLFLCLPAIFLLIKQKNWKNLFLLISSSACLVLPFIARNVLLSGYPFYPARQFNLFTVDWKVNDQMLTWLLDYIKYYNRVNDTFLPIGQTKQLAFPNWIGTWFHYLFVYDKMIVIPGLLGLFASLGFTRKFFSLHWVNKVFLLIFLFQIVSWLFIAPDPRFIYGTLLCGSFLLVTVLLPGALNISNKVFTRGIGILLSIAILSYAVLKPNRDTRYRNFVAPYNLPQPPVSELTIDSIRLRVPEKILGNWNRRCYGTDLPCLYVPNPKLRARGRDIRDGFRLEQ